MLLTKYRYLKLHAACSLPRFAAMVALAFVVAAVIAVVNLAKLGAVVGGPGVDV